MENQIYPLVQAIDVNATITSSVWNFTETFWPYLAFTAGLACFEAVFMLWMILEMNLAIDPA